MNISFFAGRYWSEDDALIVSRKFNRVAEF